MTFAQTLTDTERRRSSRLAIYSALCGCIPEMALDTGALIVVYIAMLGGGDATKMLATGLTPVAMVFFWIEVLSPDVLENNMLRQVFKLGSFAIIETTLIGIFLSPGWFGFVLPIIGFGILLISVLLFVINLDKHRNCIMPLILETLIALVAFIVMVNITEQLNWPMITLGAVSSFVAFTGLVIFHKDIWVELRKRLHIK